MTASLDLAYLVHTAPTLDLRPVIDVGDLPGRCADTFVGQPPPAHVPATPCSILPNLDTATSDDISDLAANVCSGTHQADDDLWVLAGSQPHIRAICEALGATEMALSSRDERIERLGQTVAQLSTDLRRAVDQLAIAQGVGAKYREEALRNERVAVGASAELYAERNRTVELDVLFRTERQRSEREGAMHTQTMSRLMASLGDGCQLRRTVARLETENKALQAALNRNATKGE